MQLAIVILRVVHGLLGMALDALEGKLQGSATARVAQVWPVLLSDVAKAEADDRAAAKFGGGEG